MLFKFLKISYVLLKYQRIVRRSTRLCNFTIIHLHGTEGNFCCEFCLSRFLFTTTGWFVAGKETTIVSPLVDFVSSILIWEPYNFTLFSLSNSLHILFGSDTNTYPLDSTALSPMGIFIGRLVRKVLQGQFLWYYGLNFLYIIYSYSFLAFARIGWLYAYIYLFYFPYLFLHFEYYSYEGMARILALMLNLIVS